MVAIAAQADSYPYLTIQNADGSTGTLSVETLTLTISDGQLIASNGTNSQTFSLASLGQMRFASNPSMTIPDMGWATLYSDCTLDLSSLSGVKAYTADFNDETISLTAVTKVPAMTGIIFSGEAGTYDLPVPSTIVSALSNNDLSGTLMDMEVEDGGYYALTSIDDNSVGFAVVNTGVTIPAGKAYYVNISANVPYFLLNGSATGITNVGRENKSATLYDLSGRPVTQARKGIYVTSDGKKIVKR